MDWMSETRSEVALAVDHASDVCSVGMQFDGFGMVRLAASTDEQAVDFAEHVADSARHGSNLHRRSLSSSTFTKRNRRTESRRPGLGTRHMQLVLPLVFAHHAIAFIAGAFVQLSRDIDLSTRVRRAAGLAVAALCYLTVVLAAQGVLTWSIE